MAEGAAANAPLAAERAVGKVRGTPALQAANAPVAVAAGAGRSKRAVSQRVAAVAPREAGGADGAADEVDGIRVARKEPALQHFACLALAVGMAARAEG